jgi:hypothetical protein
LNKVILPLILLGKSVNKDIHHLKKAQLLPPKSESTGRGNSLNNEILQILWPNSYCSPKADRGDLSTLDKLVSGCSGDVENPSYVVAL